MKLAVRQPGISLEGVDKTYPGGVVGVEGLELQIENGELLTIVGPSGCGKSTTLRVVAGLEEPTRGTVRLAGRDVTRWAPHRRRAVLLPQRPALDPRWTVERHLEFAWSLRHGRGAGGWRWCRSWWAGVSADPAYRRRRDEVASEWDLAPLLNRRASDLSGGEQQQVALARAMMTEPDAYLFDEPFSAVDVERRRRWRRRLKSWQRRCGRTVLYVTHDQGEALALGDRVAVMRGGKVTQCGRPAEVYGRPARRCVAETLAGGGINVLSGVARLAAGEPTFVSEHGDVRASGGARERLAKLADGGERKLTWLVRSADLQVARSAADEGDSGAGEFRAAGRIVGVEHHGDVDEVYVRLDVRGAVGETAAKGDEAGGDGAVWTARVAGWSDWREGEKVELRWNASRLLVFDAASDENLSR